MLAEYSSASWWESHWGEIPRHDESVYEFYGRLGGEAMYVAITNNILPSPCMGCSK